MYLCPAKIVFTKRSLPCITCPLLPSVADGVPFDGIPVLKTVAVAIPLSVIYVILATAGLLLAVACLVFNFIFRERK